nr:MAG TPA: Transactivating regulatory protein (Tat) [Caudoviricetes sp.]
MIQKNNFWILFIFKGGIRYGRKRRNCFNSRNGRRIIKW